MTKEAATNFVQISESNKDIEIWPCFFPKEPPAAGPAARQLTRVPADEWLVPLWIVM
jgi:hypothetical protein